MLYHDGSYKFSKHFMGPSQVPAFNGKPGGEEEQCARIIDSFDNVNTGHAMLPVIPNLFIINLN